MIVARNCPESFEPDTMMKSSVPPHAAALPPLVAAYVEATNMPTAQEKPSSQCVAADPASVCSYPLTARLRETSTEVLYHVATRSSTFSGWVEGQPDRGER
jgi:hypothetical protein